jgi:hypothetical protein
LPERELVDDGGVEPGHVGLGDNCAVRPQERERRAIARQSIKGFQRFHGSRNGDEVERAVQVRRGAGRDPMRWKDRQPGVARTHERREDVTRLRASVLLVKAESSFVAMVPVGDHERRLDAVGGVRRQSPEPARDSVELRLEVRRTRRTIGRGGPIVELEDW